MSLIALSTLALLAQTPVAQTRGADLGGDLTIIFEVGEHNLNVQETWAVRNRSKTEIPASQINLPMPQGAKFLRLDERAHGFRTAENLTSVEATESLPPSGQKDLNLGFLYDTSGTSAELSFPVPFSLDSARVIIQDTPGLAVATSVRSERRTRDLSGRTFVIYEMHGLPMGSQLGLSLTGLPAHPTWPRRLAVAMVAAIFLWMIWALRTRKVPGKEGAEPIVGPLSPRARRDQIVKAIEVLEQEFKEEKVKEKRFERRHAELLKELGMVLKEIELERS